MKNKSIVVAGIVVILLIVGVIVASHRTPSVSTPAPEPAPVGAVASNVIPSHYFEVGGAGEFKYGLTITTSASTTCDFVVPATSTIAAFNVSFARLASSTVVELGESTGGFSTTTLLARMFVTASTTGAVLINPDVVATTTVTAVADGLVYTGQHLSAKIGAGATLGTFTPYGTCNLTLRRLNH